MCARVCLTFIGLSEATAISGASVNYGEIGMGSGGGGFAFRERRVQVVFRFHCFMIVALKNAQLYYY